RLREGGDSPRSREEGRCDEGGRGSHGQGHPSRRWFRDPVRPQCRRAGEQGRRARGHPYFWSGSPRAARQEPYEDHFACAGGAVMAAKIRKGDKVVVLAGRDKGKSGEVLQVFPKEDRVLVKGVNVVVRHTRQTANQEGGLIRKE